MGVILKEVLANGRLTSRNTDPEFATKLNLLRSVAADCRTSVESLSLAAAIGQSWADVVLSGAATHEHLRENVSALDVTWDASIDLALQGLRESEQDYWHKRSLLDWN
jgi:aryl-alcohol dehydrogenase-like predicted oxidoreductase